MFKKIPVLPMLVTGLLFALACNKESSLADGDFSAISYGTKDSIPGGDTTRPDTIPHVPDSVFQYIRGLGIKAFNIRDSSFELFIETTNFYPTANAWLLVAGRLDSSTIYIEPYAVHHSGPATMSTPARHTMRSMPLAPGNYPFIVRLRGHNYTGGLTVTNTQYTFNWTHDSIITIIPKTAHRVP
jgi:hypothetical protein